MSILMRLTRLGKGQLNSSASSTAGTTYSMRILRPSLANQRLDRYAPRSPYATSGAIEHSDLVDFILEVEAARSLTNKLFEELHTAGA